MATNKTISVTVPAQPAPAEAPAAAAAKSAANPLALPIPDPTDPAIPTAPVEPTATGSETAAPAPAPAPPPQPTSPFTPELNAKLADEFLKTGTVAVESLPAGYNNPEGQKIVVDFIEGRQAVAQRNQTALLGALGGEKEYQAVQRWAETALTKEEKTTLNGTFFNADGTVKSPKETKAAAEGLYARFKQANGAPPAARVQGQPAPAGPVGYSSWYEQTKAQADPRYAKDPVYRKEVEQRIALSKY